MRTSIKALGFRSFKNRLLILIVGLIGIAQGATLLLALGYVYRDVHLTAEQELRTAQAAVRRQLDIRQTRLVATTEVLISDFGFKVAVASADSATIRSALVNQANRIGASLAVVFGPTGQVIAATTVLPSQTTANIFRQLPTEAAANEPDSSLMVIDGRPMQLVLTPLRAPEPIAWVAFGFALDELQERSLGALVHAEVRFVATNAAVEAARSGMPDPAVRLMRQDGRRYLALTLPLRAHAGAIDLLVRRPLDEVMSTYRSVRNALLAIAGISLAGAIVIALLVGRSAARPVELLAAAVRRIEAGRYDQPVRLRGASEFVHLADSFNGMQIGLRDREERIRHQAMHDALTGLPNRTGVRRRLSELLAQGASISVLLVDLHRFRDINASLEHDTADGALRAVALRLTQAVRSPDLVGRIGADQFALLLRNEDESAAERLAIAIADDLRNGLPVGELRMTLVMRAGVSTTSTGARIADDLLRQADVALLEAKERGIALVRYEAGHDALHRRGVLLVAELRRAIAQNQLSLVFQPLVRVTSGELTHFEALARWTHPTLGPISPAEFVPLAERAAVISDLTNWVLHAVIDQLRQWRQAGYRARVAVNLSASDVADMSLPSTVLGLLGDAGVSAEQLMFEVTESAIMREPRTAVRVMEQLRAAGSRFAVDDFGTGHSSLAQVHALPVDELKIDRSFISELAQSERSALIVRTAIELAHGLRLTVVAEGVETPEVWAQLLRLGCDHAQGYLVSRPLAAEDVLGWVSARHRSIAEAVAHASATGELIDLRSLRTG